jgi:DNA repair protein RadA/Sms
MAKATSHYVCQSCGAAYPKWNGKCEGCGAWNSLVEEAIAGTDGPKGYGLAKANTKAGKLDFTGLTGSEKPAPRRVSGIGEFDRVTGGGLVPGSVLLVGGDPGIGKSTLLLQVCCHLAPTSKVAYISGEEAIDQVRLRAARLGLSAAPVQLASATSVRDIIAAIGQNPVDLVIIDSIQTMYVDTLDSAPGTVAQVRACAHEFIRFAKSRSITVVLVGHVTKEGTIAGPRVLEHMVDAVLYFEGERGHHFRILRAVKNRYGATDEIGVFEMTELGLQEVTNPSALFLAERKGDVSGAVVYAGIEGTRPVLVEIQALVALSALGTPRRAVVGWDSARLSMILAVLEARCGVAFGMNDIYLNVAGGLRITEPAADLAVAAALVSALTGNPAPQEAVFFGEVGLAGEVRSVSQSEPRLKEAAKLGFTRAFTPLARGKGKSNAALKQAEINQLSDLIPLFVDDERPRKRASA